MRLPIASLFCGILLISTTIADARGRGFVAALLARGAVTAATSHSARAKSYTSDVLTVDQLVACLKKADGLDRESQQIETQRERLSSTANEIDRMRAMTESQRATLNRYSQADVDRFNREVDRYNTMATNAKGLQNTFNLTIGSHNTGVDAYNLECAKKYYADDMESARKLAGI